MLQSTQIPALKEYLSPLLERLPGIEHIPLTNGDADYYGASWRIADALRMHEILPTNTFWSHGWFHRKPVDNPLRLAFSPPQPDRTYLVFTNEHAEYLRRHGYQALAVGAPFLYAQKPLVTRIPSSLLIMPAHTTTHFKRDFSDSPFLAEVQALFENFDYKVACISGQCVKHNLWMQLFESNAVPWVTGAWIFDKHALERMKILFSSFEYMATNVMGSHIVYAAYCGCKVFFTLQREALYDLNELIKNEPLYQRYPELVWQGLKNFDFKWNQQAYPWLFNGFEGATIQKEWAAHELGQDVQQTASEIADLFGWKPQEIQRQQQRKGISRLKTLLLREQKNEQLSDTPQTLFASAERQVKSAQQLLDDAHELLNQGHFQNALCKIADIKASRYLIKGVDDARGRAFLGLGANQAAIESFKEELRTFPDNPELHQYLKQLTSGQDLAPHADECERLIWQVRDYTMVEPERLRSLYHLTKRICKDDKPGCFVECGVAAGGSSALIAWVIKRYSKRQRQLFCFDTFDGMPDPTSEDMTTGNISAHQSGWGAGTCRASIGSLQAICQTLGVLPIVRPVQGLFCETLPKWSHALGAIAFLHMDSGWHDSTRDIFDNLYDRVQPNGLIQINDYNHWAGCRKAVNEFAAKRNLQFDLKKIDATGAWMEKPLPKQIDRRLLNLGCGQCSHPNWINLDFTSSSDQVIAHDLMQGIPFEANSFDVVYHSHVLEHFPKSQAAFFLLECYRVLKPQGILRIAVSDLETLARSYLRWMEEALQGDQDAAQRYDWIMLKMFDQMVRNYSGGEMLKYWHQNPMPTEDYVVERMGSEVKKIIDNVRSPNAKLLTLPDKHIAIPEQIGRFRLSDEIHQWMYDRYSLGKLLREAGFEKISVCQADQSAIDNFEEYQLDIMADGSVRKPDSLFMEATKHR